MAAEEAKDPKRTTPRAFAGGILTLSLLTMGVMLFAGGVGYSRQIFALGRAGYLPASLARVHPRFRTPHRAILAGGVVGIAAIFSDSFVTIGGLPLTANIVTMSVFGAIVMYITSMVPCLNSVAVNRRSVVRSVRPGIPFPRHLRW